jgi:allophanate hydrolase subunit 2
MHEGVPPGGPLVRSAFVRANRAAGNDDDAAAIELAGSITLLAHAAIVVADDDGIRTLLREGDSLTLASRGARVRYVAIGGGVDAPRFLGSRCALLAAGFGRALRRGDAIERAGEPAAPRDANRTTDDGSPIAVLPGLDLLPHALDGEFRIASSSDRTGTRLEGPPLDVAHALGRPSAPMTLGAIEATPSGLVVLGPDHPTTGGYPVVGVIAARDRDRFFARPLGAIVRFAHV